jgi:hypothetical protein
MEASQRFRGDRPEPAEPYVVDGEHLTDENSGEETANPAESDITPLDQEDGPQELTAAGLSLVESPEYDEPEADPAEPMGNTVDEFMKVARKYPLLKPKQEIDLAKRIERAT